MLEGPLSAPMTCRYARRWRWPRARSRRRSPDCRQARTEPTPRSRRWPGWVRTRPSGGGRRQPSARAAHRRHLCAVLPVLDGGSGTGARPGQAGAAARRGRGRADGRRRRVAGVAPGAGSGAHGAPHRRAVRAAATSSSACAVSGEDDIARLSTSFNPMAASLQSQIRRLENLSGLQQRFVSDVSHELRTPLTTVQMAGESAVTRRVIALTRRRRDQPSSSRANSTGSRTLLVEPARPQPIRCRCGAPGAGARSISSRWPASSLTATGARRASRYASLEWTSRRSSRPTADASTGSCAIWSPTPRSTADPTLEIEVAQRRRPGLAGRPRLRRRAGRRREPPGLRPVLARGPGAYARRHGARSRDLP